MTSSPFEYSIPGHDEEIAQRKTSRRPLKASVVIPVYNGARTLERCLGALMRQTLRTTEYEVIVVDDGSSDATAAIVARYRVRLVTQPHRGPAAARNWGTAHANGPIVLFTDADTEPAPDWIETMLAPFTDRNLAGAKGTYRTRQREWVARFVQIEYEEKYAHMARAKQVDVVDTYSAAYRREVVLISGGFDESFPSASAEDAEFSFRLAKQGYRLVFIPNAVVFHQHAATLWAYCRRKFKIGYWRVRVHERHPDKLMSDTHTPPTLRVQMVLVPLVMASGIGAIFVPGAAMVFALLSVGFLLTTIPLARRACRQDRVVALMVPLFVACRALALSAGVAIGLASEILRISRIGRVIALLLGRSKPGLNPG